jgi:hypothetical protein
MRALYAETTWAHLDRGCAACFVWSAHVSRSSSIRLSIDKTILQPSTTASTHCHRSSSRRSVGRRPLHVIDVAAATAASRPAAGGEGVCMGFFFNRERIERVCVYNIRLLSTESAVCEREKAHLFFISPLQQQQENKNKQNKIQMSFVSVCVCWLFP